MPDRTLTFGGDGSDARFRVRDTDPSDSGDLVIERLDASGNVVDTIAEWDDTAEEWVFSEFTASQFFGADVLNAAENQILVTQGDGALSVETQAEGPNPYDQAQTFAESDVTITNNQTRVADGHIELGKTDEYATAVTRDADNTSFSVSSGRGLVINPNTDLNGIAVVLSSNQGQVQDVFLSDSSESILVEQTAGYSSGDVVTLETTLTAGTDYYVGVYDDGNTYTNGANDSPTYPYTSADVDIVSGVFDAHPDDASAATATADFAYAISEIQTLSDANTGNALIEWDTGVPTDIYSWDVATFTRTLDGETVTVDVEDDSGNVLLSDIDRNTDISSIADQTNVKLRANLSRNDTNNNPTLDSAYRSWFV